MLSIFKMSLFSSSVGGAEKSPCRLLQLDLSLGFTSNTSLLSTVRAKSYFSLTCQPSLLACSSYSSRTNISGILLPQVRWWFFSQITALTAKIWVCQSFLILTSFLGQLAQRSFCSWSYWTTLLPKGGDMSVNLHPLMGSNTKRFACCPSFCQ